jgi:hypothetical protein
MHCHNGIYMETRALPDWDVCRRQYLVQRREVDVWGYAPATLGYMETRPSRLGCCRISTLDPHVDGGCREICLCCNGIYRNTPLRDWEVCRRQYLVQHLGVVAQSFAMNRGVVTRQYLRAHDTVDVGP